MKNILKNIVFSALAIIIVFVIAEIGCRTYESLKLDFKSNLLETKYMKIYSNYFSPLPNINCTDLNAFAAPASTNSFGFRSKQFQIKKPKDTFRIITLGDSCTFGTGVSDEHTYSAFLEKKLNGRLNNKKYEVINAGVPAFMSYQALIRLESELMDLGPDLIILFIGWNDMGYSLISHYFESLPGGWIFAEDLASYNTKDILSTDAKIESIKEVLHKCSAFFRWLEEVGRKMKKRQQKYRKQGSESDGDVDIDKLIKRHEKLPERDNLAALKQYIRNMKHIFLLTKGRNIKTLVLSWPTILSENMNYEEKKLMKPQLNGGNSFRGFYNMYGNYQEAIREICKQNDVLYFDIAKYFRADRGAKLELFQDMGHFTDKGNELFSDKLFDALIDLKIINQN